MMLYLMFFLCMLHTYYWGDLENLIGRSSMMGSEIGILWEKMEIITLKVSHEHETIWGGGVSAIKKGEFQLLEIGLKILTKKKYREGRKWRK